MKPDTIAPESSILFLGSGFSVEARNIRGENMPTGRGLREAFAKIIGVDPNDYDLQTLADEAKATPNFNLYDFLYETFTVKSLTSNQQEILDLSWLRIYTTNYDDAVEHAHALKRRRISSFSYNEEKPRKLPSGSIIHLHGTIRSTTPENVADQLVLNEESYVRQHFQHSDWYDVFERDIRFSSTCFFVGYSLSDYHISALLLQKPSLRDKTFFITKKPDKVFSNRAEKYGHVLPVGVTGFKRLCDTLPRVEQLDPYALKSFRYIDPFKDKKILSPPTPIEVRDLVTYGTFNEARCMSSLPHPVYVAPRQELVESASNLLKQAQTLLIHSRLGNGKSIFLSILAHKLSELGFKCFWCRDVSPTLKQDVQAISTINNAVIFFDSYNVAIDVIDAIADDIPNTKFVIAIRTGVQEVRLHEIWNRVPTPFERLDLNGLRPSERENFIELLDTTGIYTRGILVDDLREEIEGCRDIRDIVLSIYKNKAVRDTLEKALEPLLRDRALRDIIITSHLLKWIGQEVSVAFLRTVTGKDAYAETARFREVAAEMFAFGEDEFKVHSSVFSEFLIDNLFNAEDVVDVIYSILVQAVKRKRERRHQAITSSLMKVSTLKEILKKDANKNARLLGLFDRLHRDIGINKEPLFWLQYSILMLDSHDLAAAENFLNTAYVRAAGNPGFQTFQIDTHALRLLLLIEERAEENSIVERFDAIMKKLSIVVSMVGEESHRAYALRVLTYIDPFIHKRLSALSIAERNALLIETDRLISTLQRLHENTHATDSTGIKKALNSAEQSKKKLLLGRSS